MKTSVTLACMLLFLAACDSAGPTPVQPPAEEELTLESLAAYVQKIVPEEATALLVVGQAALVYNVALHDAGGFISNERGFQRATWTQQDVRQAWAHDCWTGDPAFPGSDSYDACGGISGPFMDLTPREVLQTTFDMVRAIAGVEGYELLWSMVQHDPGYEHYEMCYATPSGGVYYWRWAAGTPAEQG